MHHHTTIGERLATIGELELERRMALDDGELDVALELQVQIDALWLATPASDEEAAPAPRETMTRYALHHALGRLDSLLADAATSSQNGGRR